VVSGFRRKVDEDCALLGYYSASGANFSPTFRDYRSRNVGKNLPILTA